MLKSLSVCLLAAAAVAQSPLTTTFANNNNGAVGGAVYFDLTAAVDITLTQIDVHSNTAAGTAGSFTVYTIPGSTWVGNTTNAALWTNTSSAAVTTAGIGSGTVGVLSTPIPMTAGTTLAVAIAATGFSHTYTTGTAPFPLTYSNTELTLSAGGASNVPFVGAPFSPRVFNGNVHYVLGATGTLASNTSIGQGCYRRFASFYENFATAGAFDLANSALTLTASAGGYVVTSGGSYNAVGSLGTPTALALTDDSQIAAGTLGLVVGSNGWVALGAGNSNSFTPTVATLLSNPSSAFYCWHDFNPAAAGSGLVQYEESGTMAQVTFDGVYDFAGTSAANANFVQFQVDTSTGSVVIAWQTMSTLGNGFLVGYSPGGASLDPGNSNLSDVRLGLSIIQTSATDVLPLALSATSRPVTGTNWNLQVSNSALLDLIILGLSDPMIPDLFFLGLPGCGLRANLDLLTVGSTLSVGIPANPTLVGQNLYANGASLSPSANPFGALTSNGIQGTIGDL